MTDRRRNARLTGEARTQAALAAKEVYDQPKGTIRLAAARVGVSYGLARTLLGEAGVVFKKTWTARPKPGA